LTAAITNQTDRSIKATEASDSGPACEKWTKEVKGKWGGREARIKK
jgi:hypothetical protein